jgi:hypothetical protein
LFGLLYLPFDESVMKGIALFAFLSFAKTNVNDGKSEWNIPHAEEIPTLKESRKGGCTKGMLGR